MVLEGMVPVLTQTPPTTERASTTATRFFILEAATAARCPEGPEPMTIRSYLTALMPVSLLQRCNRSWPRRLRAGSGDGPYGVFGKISALLGSTRRRHWLESCRLECIAFGLRHLPKTL